VVRLLVVAIFLLGLLGTFAQAAVSRVRWRGVETQGGTPPPRLESATASHLAVTLRSLGSGGASLVPGPPFDAEALARCSFAPKRAQCQVEVLAGELHAERRADVPFRDADDLAESIALLVSGMLQTDFADLPQQIEIEPEPAQKPPPKPPKLPEPLPELVLPPDMRPVRTAPPHPARPVAGASLKKVPEPGQLLFSVGPSVAVGFGGDPVLFGASVRAFWVARRVLRAGGTLALEGTDVSRGGYPLSFFRLVAAPRLGVGLTQGRVDVDLTAGPALHVLHAELHDRAGLSHTLTSVGLAVGARLGVLVGGGLWLEAGVDVMGSLQDEQIAAGPTPVTGFGHWWLDVAVALVYRR
jgi:hypothetical protein